MQKVTIIFNNMQKNSEKNISILEIDPISGDYMFKVPEWLISELSWYEDTEVYINLDGNELIISEIKN